MARVERTGEQKQVIDKIVMTEALAPKEMDKRCCSRNQYGDQKQVRASCQDTASYNGGVEG